MTKREGAKLPKKMGMSSGSSVERLVLPARPYSYAVVQRLRMIDFLLASFGYARSSHIADYFGISQPQATIDMKTYMKLAPDNMQYSIERKYHKRSVDFERVWVSHWE